MAGLRSFARHVEQFLEQRALGGATAPSETFRASRSDIEGTAEPQGHVPGTSSSSTRPPSYLQVPRAPTIPAPPVPQGNTPPSEPGGRSTTHFSTVRSEVRSGAIRIDITNPEQWSAGDTAILRNREAKRVQDIGSLIFETPIQHDYEASVEVRSLLPTERLEEMDGRLAVTDEDSHTPGVRFVKFWVDEAPSGSEESRNPADEETTFRLASARDVSRVPTSPERRERMSPVHEFSSRRHSRGSPDFGGGVGYHESDALPRGHIPENNQDDAYHRGHIPESNRASPRPPNTSRVPPEDQVPRGCSLHSMEPLREWFCKGADMTSPAEYEAALCQLEDDPPDIRQYNANIREERWTNFSLEGVKFPAMMVDVIQRGEALAIFESDLIIHFQQISRAAALYIRALLGGVKRTLEVYRRVDETTKNYPWSVPTTEEKWHTHAEGVFMVALTTLNLPAEAWKSARLFRAVPNS